MAKRKHPGAVALGRLGGKVKSAAKTAASRRNALLAGRPPQFEIGDPARATNKAPTDYRGRSGLITEAGPGKSEFRIEFEDGKRPTTGYLRSWWLDRMTGRKN